MNDIIKQIDPVTYLVILALFLLARSHLSQLADDLGEGVLELVKGVYHLGAVVKIKVALWRMRRNVGS